MASRAKVISGHVTSNPDDDIVIVAPLRTAVGRAKRGSFRTTPPEEMLEPVMRAVLERSGVNPAKLGDVVIGTVLPKSGQAATEVRIAELLAGIPKEVPVHTLNRQCSSGLQAIASVAAAVSAGFYEVGMAGGVESMSTQTMGWDGDVNQRATAHPYAQGCYMPMGVTSENVAERYGVTRAQQDALAVLSHAKAAAAIKAGKFKDEIVPVKAKIRDAEDDSKFTEKVVDTDEGVRPGTTAQKLAKLKTVFKANGTTTAGNSSQLSDGAAACLVMKRGTAKSLGCKAAAVIRGYAVVGVDPAVMGIGPAVAIPEAVKRAGLTIDDIDIFEINEAFASQATYCVEKLSIPMSKVNPNGGAIALGHPLGCTGARMMATLTHELKRTGKRFGVVSMCIGSGMGAAMVVEVEK